MSDRTTAAAKEEAGDGASASCSSSSKQQTGVPGQEQGAEKTKGASSGRDESSALGEGSSDAMIDGHLQDLMSRVMQIQQGFGGADKEKDVPKLLDEVSLEGVVQYIKSSKCSKIVTMVGAGISTSAGIPDFRSPGSGLYDNLQQYNLPHPQAIFMIDYFLQNPKPFFVLAKDLFPGSLKPTLCHYFIQLLNMKGLLLRHYTQNIDTLERVAGLAEEKLVEAHGTFNTAHCLQCAAQYTLPWMKEKIFADEIPTCEASECTGVVKPDIVFFGEPLPSRFAECVSKDLKQCDLLIIMGTSLVVQPFASLVSRLPSATPRLYINLEKPPSAGMNHDDLLALLVGGGGGFSFNDKNNYRDVFQQTTCDDGCAQIAEMLGWGEELRALMKEGHERIDRDMAADSKPKTQEGGAASASL